MPHKEKRVWVAGEILPMPPLVYSARGDPDKWVGSSHFYCPKWAQPVVIWFLVRVMKWKQVGRPRHST